MAKNCIICGDEESEEVRLYELPCWTHWVCKDDIASFFINATNSENLYPPRCCDEIILLQDWEEHVPHDVQLAFQLKEQGEYAIMPKYRVYCADGVCASFLHPQVHITDPQTEFTYALCEAEGCGKITCINCRSVLRDGIENHKCQDVEDEKKFQETVKAEGYQECFLCGRTVELAEACNHITCECGNAFCYICGKEWEGPHGCPRYGIAEYDEEGYNQEGYHRDTGLNRHDRTRRQQTLHDQGEDEDDEGGEGQGENGPDHDVLQHVDDEIRNLIDNLNPEMREDALDQLRIGLLETLGITFEQPEHGQPGDDNNTQDEGEEHSDEESDEESEEDGNRENDFDDDDQEQSEEDTREDDGSETLPEDAQPDNADLYEDPTAYSDDEAAMESHTLRVVYESALFSDNSESDEELEEDGNRENDLHNDDQEQSEEDTREDDGSETPSEDAQPDNAGLYEDTIVHSDDEATQPDNADLYEDPTAYSDDEAAMESHTLRIVYESALFSDDSD